MGAKIDGDVIVATMMGSQHLTIESDCGIMFIPHGSLVLEKYVGHVKIPGQAVIKLACNFIKLTPWQRDYARRLVKFLNYDLHHDGAWSVLWGNPTIVGVPTKLHYAYQDVDGDVQFVIESDRKLTDLMRVDDVKSHGENAEKAHVLYRERLTDVEIRPEQRIKAALGERPFDPTIEAPIV